MKSKSHEQVKYYWGLVLPMIADRKGWSLQQSHQWVKDTWDIDSTKPLSTIEYEDLLNHVRVHTNLRWGLLIPLPNEDLEEEKQEEMVERIFLGKNPDLAERNKTV